MVKSNKRRSVRAWSRGLGSSLRSPPVGVRRAAAAECGGPLWTDALHRQHTARSHTSFLAARRESQCLLLWFPGVCIHVPVPHTPVLTTAAVRTTLAKESTRDPQHSTRTPAQLCAAGTSTAGGMPERAGPEGCTGAAACRGGCRSAVHDGRASRIHIADQMQCSIRILGPSLASPALAGRMAGWLLLRSRPTAVIQHNATSEPSPPRPQHHRPSAVPRTWDRSHTRGDTRGAGRLWTCRCHDAPHLGRASHKRRAAGQWAGGSAWGWEAALTCSCRRLPCPVAPSS
jgi:hypothetical protein